MSTMPSPPVSKAAFWTGWVLSALPALLMLFAGTTALIQPPFAVEGMEKMEYPIEVGRPLGVVQVACTLIYLIPQTAVLGAILLTGFLGGAVATHVRVSEPFFMPIIVAVVFWLGLYLREPRLRALVPWRR